MLWSLICSLITIAFCLLLHYYQHFRLISCYKKSKSFINTSSSFMKTPRAPSVLKLAAVDSFNRFQNKTSWRCCLASVDDESFDLYPFAFLFYVLLLLIVTVSITIKYICIENEYHINTTMPLHHTFSTHYAPLNLIDWMIIHCVIITTSLESLFNFYRYYSIKYTTEYMHSPSTTLILQYFSLYLMCFALIFLVQIHFYYLLFPLVVFVYCSYNVFCSYAFSAIFTNQYQRSNILSEVADDMIHSVQFMRNTSIFACFMSTILLSILLSLHNIHYILYYLPLCWAVSSFALTLNFVRNRQCLYQKLFKLYQYIQHCKRKTVSFNSQKHTVKRDIIDIIIHKDVDKHPAPPTTDVRDRVDEGVSTTHTSISTHNGSNAPIAPKPIVIETNEQKHNDIEYTQKHVHKTSSKPTKALRLLGLSNAPTPVTLNDDNQEAFIHNTMDMDDEQDMVFVNQLYEQQGNTPLSQESEISVQHLRLTLKASSSEKAFHSYSYKPNPLTATRTRSISDPEFPIKIERDNASNAVVERKPMYNLSPPTSPSAPTVSIHQIHTLSDIKYKHVQSISCQSPVSYLPHSPNSMKSVSYNMDGNHTDLEDKPIVNASKMDSDGSDDVVKVLRLLVGHGFYSRKSWNSIQQLQEFQKTNNICK